MSLTRKKIIELVIERFGYLRNVIESSNSQNFTTINVISENFFRDLLNLVFDLKLVKINIEEANATAIDLGDLNEKTAIQVTATGSKAKVAKTLKKFCEKDLHNSYDTLIILISTKKVKFQTKTLDDKSGKFSISLEDHVWDWDELIAKINDLPQERMKIVQDFVEAEISIEMKNVPRNEVATFIDLMEVLSDETHAEAGKGVLKEPDPEGKIEGRFSAHSDYLLQEYASYYSEYGSVLAETIRTGDLGAPRLRRLGLHLGTKSNQMLSKSGGNPEQALEKLVEFYVDTLQKHDKASDEGAVRFFMLEQMIKCHVFPNPVKKSA